MKKLSLITKICIVIFLFIISMAILLSVPMYRRLEQIVDKYSVQFTQQIAEQAARYERELEKLRIKATTLPLKML